MATTYTHSIPTPPFSPQMPDENTENPLKSTINLLDSLVAFYQHERMWVYRTRAMLAEAFPNPSVMDITQSLSASHNEAPTSEPLASYQTRWTRRKKGFKLRLDGIRPKRVISAIPVDHVRQPEYLHPREQLLEMFEKMMESRMESCQRINKLVRDANRANLHNR